ncbi:hypothetical protein TPCU411_09180 [Cutibacterium acnes]|nr:hypothetical protein TPCU411_09180 [Cutibacterium acnes]
MTAIKTRPVHGYSKFLSTGSARGSRVVTNKEMCTLIDSTPEWIEQRTGITERRWATNSETVASMGTTAARTALERSGLEASQIDAIIVATVSHHRPSPAWRLTSPGSSAWVTLLRLTSTAHVLGFATQPLWLTQ